MAQCNYIVAICMEFSMHYFSYIDVYLACEGTTSDDTPILNVSEWEGS